jgi:hypothetical protein
MPFPTTNATQELPAINKILASCGQAPVTTLDQTNPEVAIAYDTLLQVSREVQAEGWTFNTEFEYKLTPNTDDYILLPANMLQVKLSRDQSLAEVGLHGHKDGVRRSGQYTVQPKSFNITNDGASGGTNGDLTALKTTTTGSGRGLTVDITIKNNVTFEIRVKEPGINYILNDTITIASSLTGTAQNVVSTISATTPVLGPMLYDRTHHSYKWTEESIFVDVIWLYDWVDLPVPVQDFIVSRAAVLTSQRIVGDGDQYSMLQQQEAYTRTLAMQYETNQGEFSFFGMPQANNRNYVSYQPFKALYR